MGFGDDLMITAHASEIKKKFPERQIVIGSVAKKQAYHSIIYENNPNISDCTKLDLNKPIHVIDYHPGNRPYIDYKNSTKTKYFWNKEFKPTPGQLYFSKKEISEAKDVIKQAISFWKKNHKKIYKKIIFLETSSTKINDKQFSIKHKNKDWGIKNWLDLVNKIKDEYLIILSVHEKTKSIDGVFSPENVDFRKACSILNKCDIYIGPEGGFGHVAAALNKKAIIYFGGWITPDVIGYNFHENIYYDNSQSPCGEYLYECPHCNDARDIIKPDLFIEKLKNIF